MKSFLMHRDRDFDARRELPWNHAALTQDLELDTLLRAMAGDDGMVLDVSRAALFAGLHGDVGTILYRQGALKDCLRNPAAVRVLYALAVQAIEGTKKRWWWGITSDQPSSMLYSSIEVLDFLLVMLRKLREVGGEQGGRFESEAFTALFATVARELGDEYLASIQNHLKELRFRRGVLLSAGLGESNEGTDYVLVQAREKRRGWLQRALGRGAPGYSFRLDNRDEAGATILASMRQQGIARAAIALSRSADHVLSFFGTLRTELAFYIGCLNLHGRLTSKGEPLCFPVPVPPGERRHRFTGLYDPCLSLLVAPRVVGNAAEADAKGLVVITGANQGGKSIFLRSIGLAQAMMQCGMFVAAESFTAELCAGLFTHYKREADATMLRGKLDEELARMSELVDHLAPDALLLCNESFAATNEREGSEIARQILCALLERRVKVFFVTHLYELAHALSARKAGDTLFLRAERLPDGTRPFKLMEGEPLETSYGEDLYRELFPAGIRLPNE